jgi:uncharacterized protein
MRVPGAAPQFVIIANSAGLLARAAVAGNYHPLVIDAYGDQDTLASALDYRRLHYIDNKIEAASLFATLQDFDDLYGPLPILWGSGWEASAHILAALSATREVLGSPFRALSALANPTWYSRSPPGQCLRRFRTTRKPQPASTLFAPALFESDTQRDMLVKARARAGGHAVCTVAGERFLSSRQFFQVRLAGRSISALCVADGKTCSILGWSEHVQLQRNTQWPFRYSGAVTMSALPDERGLREELRVTAKKLGLVGLFGCDFIENRNGDLSLVDLNPRPPATTPLHLAQADIINVHLHPNHEVFAHQQAAATAVVYADIPIRITKKIDWPSWTSDIPNEERTYCSGEPLCTLWVSAVDTRSAEALLRVRLSKLMAWLEQSG